MTHDDQCNTIDESFLSCPADTLLRTRICVSGEPKSTAFLRWDLRLDAKIAEDAKILESFVPDTRGVMQDWSAQLMDPSANSLAPLMGCILRIHRKHIKVTHLSPLL